MNDHHLININQRPGFCDYTQKGFVRVFYRATSAYAGVIANYLFLLSFPGIPGQALRMQESQNG